MKKLSAIFITTALLVFAGGCLNVFRKTDPDVSKKSAEIRIGARELTENFMFDEDSANSRYLDKIILVEGVVNSIATKEEVITVYLKNEEDISGVQCNFNPGSIDINSISNGQQIKVKGVCSGFLLDVVLNRCTLEKE
jgi:hypothetical protein